MRTKLTYYIIVSAEDGCVVEYSKGFKVKNSSELTSKVNEFLYKDSDCGWGMTDLTVEGFRGRRRDDGDTLFEFDYNCKYRGETLGDCTTEIYEKLKEKLDAEDDSVDDDWTEPEHTIENEKCSYDTEEDLRTYGRMWCDECVKMNTQHCDFADYMERHYYF